FFFFQAEDGIRDATVTGVQTCALPIWTYPLPGRLLARPVCPSNGAASRRRSQKKNARLWKKSGVRAVTSYSGLACSSVVVIVVEIGRASCRVRVWMQVVGSDVRASC